MIKTFFLLFLIPVLLLSCNPNKDRIEIPFVTYIEIPAGLNSFLTYHFPAKVATLGQAPANMKEAIPARMRAFIETGEGSFNFVRRAYMDAITDSSQVEMGYNLDVPLNSSNTLDLYPSIADLKDMITQDSFNIEFNIDLRTNTTVTSRVRIEFTVQAVLEN
jgi:hypothetical protein